MVGIDTVDLLSKELQVVFKPLIDELRDLGEPLDREEFVDASNRLYTVLNQNDKNLILRFGKKTKESYIAEQCTFKPVINSQRPGSAALASKRSESKLQRPASSQRVTQ